MKEVLEESTFRLRAHVVKTFWKYSPFTQMKVLPILLEKWQHWLPGRYTSHLNSMRVLEHFKRNSYFLLEMRAAFLLQKGDGIPGTQCSWITASYLPTKWGDPQSETHSHLQVTEGGCLSHTLDWATWEDMESVPGYFRVITMHVIIFESQKLVIILQ